MAGNAQEQTKVTHTDATRAPARPRAFDEQLLATLQVLRATLVELLLAVDEIPVKPQAMARRFGLNKNLTWKIAKVVNGADPYAAVPHIPGAQGFEIFFRALKRHEAPAQLLDEARRAAAEFARLVKTHTGDRTTLDIMVSSRLPAAVRSEQSELNRKRAYQANTGIWGVGARTQLALNILAPSADDPDMADLAQVSGLDHFRRLKPDARWLLFRRERWSDDDPRPGPDQLEPLDPDFPVENGVPLIGAFCSKPIPEIEMISDEGEDQYELPPGPVGNTAYLTCIHGQVARKVGPAYAEAEGERSEIGCNLVTPVENLVLDLLVHRDFEWAMNPDFLVYSRMDGGAMHAAARRERNVLAVADTVNDLGWGVTTLTTPLLATYPRLVRYVFERLGWDADDFRAFRVTMRHPPIPTAALLCSTLPVRGGDAATKRRSDEATK